MDSPRVRIFLDDETVPFLDRALPAEVSLDTTDLTAEPATKCA